jgi:SAM-dependent methyltransferase
VTGDRTALNRATYDRIASRYAENHDQQLPEGGRFFASLEDAFLARLPAGGVVADLGCGPGRDGARFRHRGYVVVGVDLSAAMLGLAATGLGGRVAQGDLRALPLGPGSLDGIWTIASLLHVPEVDTAAVLRGFRRVLRPDGVLSLVTALGEDARLEPVAYAPDETRWFVYRRAVRLRAQLAVAGFEIELEEEGEGNRRWWSALARAA